MNCVNLIGRLTRDPEPKMTSSGVTLLTFSIAVDRGDKDRNTDFINCQAWRTTAEFITKYFHKGDPIAVTGKIVTRSYEKDGQTIKVFEVLTTEAGFVPKTSSGSRTEAPQENDGGGISF